MMVGGRADSMYKLQCGWMLDAQIAQAVEEEKVTCANVVGRV